MGGGGGGARTLCEPVSLVNTICVTVSPVHNIILLFFFSPGRQNIKNTTAVVYHLLDVVVFMSVVMHEYLPIYKNTTVVEVDHHIDRRKKKIVYTSIRIICLEFIIE